jgi:hypothetical protein
VDDHQNSTNRHKEDITSYDIMLANKQLENVDIAP